MESKKTLNSQSNSRKNNKAGGITADLPLYYKTVAIKKEQYIYKSRHIGRWNRIESPETNPSIQSQLQFDKGAMNIQMGKGQSLP